MEYPVAFRCASCNEDKISLDSLELHIWTDHIDTFPYRCSLCGYPTVSSSAIIAHCVQTHGSSSSLVEFTRKLSDEIRLRNLISQSIVVRREENDQDNYEEVQQNDMVQHLPVDGHNLDQDVIVSAEEVIGVVDDQVETRWSQKFIAEHKADDLEDYDVTYEQVIPASIDDFEHEQDVQYVDEYGNPIDVFPDEQQHPMLTRSSIHAFHHKPSRSPSKKTISIRRRKLTVHQCDVCGKVLKYPSKIAEHMRSHTGERPHICNHCGLAFSQKGSLKCHQRLHTGERPFECTWNCGRSFVSSSGRKMHEKVHTGERPFSCSFCCQLFGKKSHMLRHERNKHGPLAMPVLRIDAPGLEVTQEVSSTVDEVIEHVRRNRNRRKKGTKILL